jgi:Flp pilus assembly protein TadD
MRAAPVLLVGLCLLPQSATETTNDRAAWEHYKQATDLAGTGGDGVEGHLRQAIALLPTLAEAHNDLGLLRSREGDDEEAKVCLLRSAELQPVWYTYNNLAALVKTSAERNAYYRQAIELSPTEPVPYVNLGYQLENSGQVQEAISLYENALTILPNNGALQILRAIAAPATFKDQQEPIRWRRYTEVHMSKLLELARTSKGRRSSGGEFLTLSDPLREIGSIPFRQAYTGFETRTFMRNLSAVYQQIEPAASLLAFTSPALLGALPQESTAGRPRQWKREQRNRVGSAPHLLRLGVLSEYHGNISPGKLLQPLLLALIRRANGVEVVFFARQQPADAITSTLEEEARDQAAQQQHTSTSSTASPDPSLKLVYLPRDLPRAQRLIGAEECDVLLFSALGMCPLSYFLAFARLAPVQLQYGHGHPVTSAAPGVDYFVSSELFEGGDIGRDVGGKRDSRHAHREAVGAGLVGSMGLMGPVVPDRGGGGGGGGGEYQGGGHGGQYEEQMVRFTSSSTAFEEPPGGGSGVATVAQMPTMAARAEMLEVQW